MNNEKIIINKIDDMRQSMDSFGENEKVIMKKIDNLEENEKVIMKKIDNLEENEKVIIQEIGGLKLGQIKLTDEFFKLHERVDKSDQKTKGYRDEIVGLLEDVMSELKINREEQTAHVGSHEIIDFDHLDLKKQVENHEVRIKVLEPA